MEDTCSKVQKAIGTENYKVTTLDPHRYKFAECSRDFSWIIMIVLILLIWPIALVYYFTRQRSSVTITVTPNSDGDANFGCRVNINSNGNSGERILQTLVSILR